MPDKCLKFRRRHSVHCVDTRSQASDTLNGRHPHPHLPRTHITQNWFLKCFQVIQTMDFY